MKNPVDAPEAEAVGSQVECPVRRAVASVSGWRYGMQPCPPALTWHPADRRGRAYRCRCMPMFRVGADKYGPAHKAKKMLRTRWRRRPSVAGFMAWL